jgi:hypothetical protein
VGKNGDVDDQARRNSGRGGRGHQSGGDFSLSSGSSGDIIGAANFNAFVPAPGAGRASPSAAPPSASGSGSHSRSHASPAPRGVCWSNLQDLTSVPDDEAVYILVFGAGTGSEGLYSLQERTKDDIPVDIILAFTTNEDASRYATLLEAEMGRMPVVEAARPRDLRYTCKEGGYRCKVAKSGVLLMPPEKTVEVTDWERTNALRQGQWSVTGGEGGGHDMAGETDEIAPLQTMARLDDYGDHDEELAREAIEDFDAETAREMLTRMFNSNSESDWDTPSEA